MKLFEAMDYVKNTLGLSIEHFYVMHGDIFQAYTPASITFGHFDMLNLNVRGIGDYAGDVSFEVLIPEVEE